MSDSRNAAGFDPPAEYLPILEELTRTFEAIERRAWGALATADGADGLVQLLDPDVDHLMFNRILGLDTSHPVPTASLDSMIRRLEKFRRSWLKLALRLESPAAPIAGFEIRPLAAAEAERAAQILMAGFDMPVGALGRILDLFTDERLHKRAAIVDGQVAGVGVIFIDPPAAYLSMAATAPAFRQRGIQKGLMQSRLALAAELGCQWAFTETGAPIGDEPNPSLKNMRACGFEPLYVLDNHAPRGTRW